MCNIKLQNYRVLSSQTYKIEISTEKSISTPSFDIEQQINMFYLINSFNSLGGDFFANKKIK